MKKENKKQNQRSMKYVNNNVVVSTNEFMQLFMLKHDDYSFPSVTCSEIILRAKKNIDKKAEIEIWYELVHTFKSPEYQKAILSAGANALKNSIVKNRMKEISIFTREEIIMYMILFNHYVENQDNVDNQGNIVISLKEIHCKYRNKTLKMYSQIDEKTRQSYSRAIYLLGEKNIYINTEICKMSIAYIRKNYICSVKGKLLDYEPIREKDGKTLRGIKYNLGDFGNLLLISKRMTSKFPVELLEKSYKQIGQVFIGLYISKMLYINNRKKRCKNGITISVPSILNNILYFDQKGNNTSQTLLERLNDNTKQSFSLVKTFEANLKEVLELYKKYKYIENYEIDNISVATYRLKSTKVKIFVN